MRRKTDGDPEYSYADPGVYGAFADRAECGRRRGQGLFKERRGNGRSVGFGQRGGNTGAGFRRDDSRPDRSERHRGCFGNHKFSPGNPGCRGSWDG